MSRGLRVSVTRLPSTERAGAAALSPARQQHAHPRADARACCRSGSGRRGRRRTASFRRRRCPCRPVLVVSNGLNSRSRTNSGLMPTPVSVTSITANAAFACKPHRDAAAIGRRVERVLHQMADHVLEAVLVSEAATPGDAARASIGDRCADFAAHTRRTTAPRSTGRHSPPALRRYATVASACSCARRRARPWSACRAETPDCRDAARRCCSISESCATRFFRSCTTNADMRLKASNLRASSSASVARIWPR